MPANKSAPVSEVKKPDTSGKTTAAKTAPAAEPKKPETPAKTTDPKAAPAPELKKTEVPAKATDLKTAPTADPKKPEVAAKATDTKTVPVPEPKKAEAPSKAADGPKGVTVTQVFADRLRYPSKEDLASLPIPKEGEGFSMRLHPAYFFQFLDHPFSINREVKDYKDLFESIKENGINEPIKARPREGGGLELLSGHRRHDVAMQLNYPVPVVIVQADDDTARIEVVDGNLHRMDTALTRQMEQLYWRPLVWRMALVGMKMPTTPTSWTAVTITISPTCSSTLSAPPWKPTPPPSRTLWRTM